MTHSKLISTVVYCVMLVMVSVSCKQETLTKAEKKVFPWYIYKEGSSFQDIEPVKELVHSISVFGNPPKSFIDECHRNNIEVYHAVGGSEENIDTPDKIKTLVDGYVKDCSENGYDGIDMDFEHLSADVQSTYTGFLELASQELHAAGKKLSHCVGFYPALYEDETTPMFHDPDVLARTCDLVRVMCYDMYFAPGVDKPELKDRDDCMGVGPTANFAWTKETMAFWIKRIPKQKLVMALPAYSNDYAVSGNIRGRQIYQAVPDSVSGVLPAPTWLCYEKVNMYLYDGSDGNRHLFYASDARSTEALLKLADELEIPQIGFWHFSSVDPQVWDVTEKWKKQTEHVSGN